MEALIGVIIGWALSWATDLGRRWWRTRAHKKAICAEVEICREYAETWRSNNGKHYMAPLYRLPVSTYSTALPELLSLGVLDGAQAKALIDFFNHVETMNRGLDRSDAARGTPRIQTEDNRNTKKINSFFERYYPAAKKALKC